MELNLCIVNEVYCDFCFANRNLNNVFCFLKQFCTSGFTNTDCYWQCYFNVADNSRLFISLKNVIIRIEEMCTVQSCQQSRYPWSTVRETLHCNVWVSVEHSLGNTTL